MKAQKALVDPSTNEAENPLYETKKILWPALLEKAWAKVKGGYGHVLAHRDNNPEYDAASRPLGDIIDYGVVERLEAVGNPGRFDLDGTPTTYQYGNAEESMRALTGAPVFSYRTGDLVNKLSEDNAFTLI